MENVLELRKEKGSKNCKLKVSHGRNLEKTKSSQTCQDQFEAKTKKSKANLNSREEELVDQDSKLKEQKESQDNILQKLKRAKKAKLDGTVYKYQNLNDARYQI